MRTAERASYSLRWNRFPRTSQSGIRGARKSVKRNARSVLSMKYVGRRSSNSATARTSSVRRVAVLVVVFMGSSGTRRTAPTRELLPGGERGPFLHHTLRSGHGPESTNSPVTTDCARVGLMALSVFARGSRFGGQVAASFPGPRSGSPEDEAAGQRAWSRRSSRSSTVSARRAGRPRPPACSESSPLLSSGRCGHRLAFDALTFHGLDG